MGSTQFTQDLGRGKFDNSNLKVSEDFPNSVKRNFLLDPLKIENGTFSLKPQTDYVQKAIAQSAQPSPNRQNKIYGSQGNSSMHLTSPQAFAQLKSPVIEQKQETTKVFIAADIQKQIQNIIQNANDDIKDIHISQSSGMLSGEYKKKLVEQMKSNLNQLEKLEKLSKNPFLHNDFLYNRVMKSALNYYQKIMLKQQNILKDKIEWIESQYFHWLTKLIKILQYFQSNDVLHMKQEVANVYNWFQNFSKFIEGLKLLEYPRFYKQSRKKSTELLEMDKMSNHAISISKTREKETEDKGIFTSTDQSHMQLVFAGGKVFGGSAANKIDLNTSTQSKNQVISFQKVSKLDTTQNVVTTTNVSQINVEPLLEIKKRSDGLSAVAQTELNSPLLNFGGDQTPANALLDTFCYLNRDNDINKVHNKGDKQLKNDLNIEDKLRENVFTPKQSLFKAKNDFYFPHNLNTPHRMLPKIQRKDKSQTFVSPKTQAQTTSKEDINADNSNIQESNDLVLPNYRGLKPHQESVPLMSQKSSILGGSDTDSSQEVKNSVSSSEIGDEDMRRPENLRKKYLIEAPLNFKINPPPKIVDLTSDFFEKDTEQLQKQMPQGFGSSQKGTSSSPKRANQQASSLAKPLVRTIINNPRQNAIMVEQGKRKINNLKNFYGKMISDALMKEFELMFAPLDENNDVDDYAMNGALNDLNQTNKQSLAQTVLNQTQAIIPPGMIHDDILNTQRQADEGSVAKNGIFEFKQSGISMIRRTAQDDYRYQQLNEILDLKNLLVKRGINLNQKVLQRAILMPEDQVFDGQEKQYPKPGDALMINPFPKKSGAKKKKKKR